MRNPYVTGAYVTEHRHYGREELIDSLLHGQSHAYWVVGTRRIGKTSLLRQLETLALAGPRLVPVFWDMQGSNSYARLGQYLADAVAEQSDRLAPLSLSVGALEEEDPARLLATLRRAASRNEREILLLCDETEVLIKIAETEPEEMQRLHRELTAGKGLRAVVASTQTIYRMHDVCRDWPTSPFLAGFDMAHTLGSLSTQNAHALICQAQSPEPVEVAPEVVEAISDYTNNHPYLIQLLCARLLQAEEGWLRAVTPEDLEVDPVLRGFFSVDFHALTAADQRIVCAVHAAQVIEAGALARELGCSTPELRQRVHNLEQLGYLRLIYGQIAIGNQFLSHWLSTEPGILKQPPAQMTEVAMQTALANRQAQEAQFLRNRLNRVRTRLLELEAIRARDLLDVAPAVLVEIDQAQRQVQELRRRLKEMT